MTEKIDEIGTTIWDDFDSRWETKDVFVRDLVQFDIKNYEFNDKVISTDNPYKFSLGGVPLYTKGTTAYVDNSDTHTIIIGATGSKKTRLIGMPTLQILAQAGESFIATDPKGELYKRTAEILEKNGYKTIVINLREPLKGNCWNPLALPYKLYITNEKENIDKARELLDDLAHNMILSSLSKDAYWDNSAQDFFLGLCEMLFKNYKNADEINLRSVCVLRAQAMANNLIKENYFKQLDKKSFEYACLSGTVEVADTTQACILSVFDQHMRMFSSQDALIDMLSFTDIDFSTIGKEKTALFLIVPDEKTTYHKLVSVFIKQCYENLIMDAQKMFDQRLATRVNFVLDEFSSLPTIRDFPAMITASRSRNIRFNLIIQSKHQLKERYGDEEETIKSNCANWIFLTSRERPMLEEVSILAGNKSKDVPLVSVSKLQRLDKNKGEALIFHGRCFPYVSRLVDINEYQFAKNREVAISKREERNVAIFNFIDFDKKLKESLQEVEEKKKKKEEESIVQQFMTKRVTNKDLDEVVEDANDIGQLMDILDRRVNNDFNFWGTKLKPSNFYYDNMYRFFEKLDRFSNKKFVYYTIVDMILNSDIPREKIDQLLLKMGSLNKKK